MNDAMHTKPGFIRDLLAGIAAQAALSAEECMLEGNATECMEFEQQYWVALREYLADA